MREDALEIQEIVDKMTEPAPLGGWNVNDKYAPEFFEKIDGYIKKAAYKSECEGTYDGHRLLYPDPENAFAETRFQVWRALKKYGPRPHGNLFADYTLKLKTNNTLTNLHKKRTSNKTRINHDSDSLDEIFEAESEGFINKNIPSYNPIDLSSIGESICDDDLKELLQDNDAHELVNEDIINNFLRSIDSFSQSEKRTVLYTLIAKILRQDINDVVFMCSTLFNLGSFLLDLKHSLYYDNAGNDNDLIEDHIKEEHGMNTNDIKTGDRYVTKGYGKVIEIRGKTQITEKNTNVQVPGFKVYVFATDKEIGVPVSYILERTVKFTKDVPVSGVFDDDISNLSLEDSNSDEGGGIADADFIKRAVDETTSNDDKKHKPKLKVTPDMVDDSSTESEQVTKPNTKTDKGEKKMEEKDVDVKVKKGAKKAFLIQMLKENDSVTMEELAKGLIENGLSKNGDLKKEKSYVGVTLHHIKKDPEINFVRLSKGSYTIQDV